MKKRKLGLFLMVFGLFSIISVKASSKPERRDFTVVYNVADRGQVTVDVKYLPNGGYHYSSSILGVVSEDELAKIGNQIRAKDANPDYEFEPIQFKPGEVNLEDYPELKNFLSRQEGATLWNKVLLGSLVGVGVWAAYRHYSKK